MNLLDAMIGGIRHIYENGTELPFKRGLDFVDMAITETSDRLSLVVAGLRGVPVSATPPMGDQVLAYDGAKWAPTTLAAQLPSGVFGQFLTYTTTWTATDDLILRASAPRTISVATPAAGGGVALSIVGGPAQSGAGGAVNLQPGLATSGDDNGHIHIRDAEGNIVISVGGTSTHGDEQSLSFYGAPLKQRQSLSRTSCTWRDVADAIANLNLIELTGSWLHY